TAARGFKGECPVENKPEVIRQQMQETRTALTEKLEALEHQVVETVQGARSAVTDTVESVRGAVHDTVCTVKETFDLNRQVERHPWAMVGGSFALGYVSGRLLKQATSALGRPGPGRGAPAAPA